MVAPYDQFFSVGVLLISDIAPYDVVSTQMITRLRLPVTDDLHREQLRAGSDGFQVREEMQVHPVRLLLVRKLERYARRWDRYLTRKAFLRECESCGSDGLGLTIRTNKAGKVVEVETR